jgi:hypothetical protein
MECFRILHRRTGLYRSRTITIGIPLLANGVHLYPISRVMNEENKFVGPGKVFETEEEEFAEYIAMMEWATQVTPEELERFRRAVKKEIRRRGDND